MNEIDAFFGQGAKLCSRGLAIVTDFRCQISRLSANVIEEELSDLSRSLGLGVALLPSAVQAHHNPFAIDSDWNRLYLWAAAKVVIPGLGTGYFGIYWGGESGHNPDDARVVAAIQTVSRPYRDKLLEAALQHGLEVKKEWGNEVSLFKALSASSSEQSFQSDLRSMIDQWVTFFSSVGGIQGLTRIGQ